MNNLIKRTRDIKPYDPWQDFFNTESFFPSDFMRSSKLPAVNISEDDRSFHVEVVAPGFKKDDFKIDVADETLTISAESKISEETNNKQYNRREYSYSSFTRSFQLPENAIQDNIGANYADGVLKLSIPKSKQQTKPHKQIAVN